MVRRVQELQVQVLWAQVLRAQVQEQEPELELELEMVELEPELVELELELELEEQEQQRASLEVAWTQEQESYNQVEVLVVENQTATDNRTKQVSAVTVEPGESSWMNQGTDSNELDQAENASACWME